MENTNGLNTFHERLTLYREKAGLSKKEAARELGVKYTRYVNWENGTALPSAQYIYEICKLFNASADELLQTSKEFALEIDEAKIIETYRDLSPSLKELYRNVTSTFGAFNSEGGEIEKKIHFISFPVYDQSASAGTGHFLDSDHYEMLEFPESAVPPGATFGVRVSGDSMEPDYPDGSIVFVHHTKELLTGEIGVFILNGSAYIKRLGEKGLESINEKYKPRDINEYDSLRVVGKVIGYPYEK